MENIRIYYTDSYDGKSSHALLTEAAAVETGLPADVFEIHNEQGQKPFFVSHPNLHFSISHSGRLWMCAFAEDEIGVDVQIQATDRPCVKLAQRFFHPDEADEVKNAEDTVGVLTRIWSRKEAVVKLLGIGIDSRFPQFDSRGHTVEFMGEAVHLQDIRLPITDDHSAAVAYCGEFEVRMIKLR